MTVHHILIASDLDRTILPNGPQTESPGARPRLCALAQRPEVELVYVSGRGKTLLQEAVTQYAVPLPRYAIGDVGTTIFLPQADWQPLDEWQAVIAQDWNGRTYADLQSLLKNIPELCLQEAEKQNTFKLSYYAHTDTDVAALRAAVQQQLEPAGVHASLIWSIDEIAQTGLFDVLPARATKAHAVTFLRTHLGYSEGASVFCGDSGNDLPALTSGMQAVLVANARDDVKKEALDILREKDAEQKLYIAYGGFLGMNGNYSAGVLEGVAHFFPHTIDWMRV
ncbi:MAG: HAD-IIB family hydrolase [Candidatus Peribacteraceae bacterium]|nr:HAD-IIB family hydrolase [Candidatus Peribacteria bacterium]